MIALPLMLALASGCSCETPPDEVDAASPRDAAASDAPSPERDASETTCSSRQLVPMRVESFELAEPGTAIVGRSFRVRARIQHPDGCHTRAMTDVKIDNEAHTVDIRVRDWALSGRPCADGATSDARLAVLYLSGEGAWTIRDASPGGSAELSVSVGRGSVDSGTRDACLSDDACQLEGVCLAAEVGGEVRQRCVEPCEDDNDCAPHERCAASADGYERVCVEASEPCDPASCAPGFACDDTWGRCEAAFTLDDANRDPCTCDSDCAPGLVCVVGAAGPRCEAPCTSEHVRAACGEQQACDRGYQSEEVSTSVCVYSRQE